MINKSHHHLRRMHIRIIWVYVLGPTFVIAYLNNKLVMPEIRLLLAVIVPTHQQGSAITVIRIMSGEGNADFAPALGIDISYAHLVG